VAEAGDSRWWIVAFLAWTWIVLREGPKWRKKGPRQRDEQQTGECMRVSFHSEFLS
jgi:hypothetical protein